MEILMGEIHLELRQELDLQLWLLVDVLELSRFTVLIFEKIFS